MRPGVRAMLVSTIYFALMNVCVKQISHVPAHQVILFRSVISFILSYAFLRYNQISPWGNNRLILVLRGLFGVVSLTSFFITLQKMPLATAITLQYLSPIFTISFAIFILKEKTRLVQWIFFLVSLAGVILLGGLDPRIEMLYILLGIISAVFSGLAYNMIRLAGRSEHPVVIVMYFPLVAIPIIGVWCLSDWTPIYDWDWLFLILTGILTQLAQVNLAKAYQLEEPSQISAFQYLGLVYSLALGYFIFGETHPLISIGGMFLVVTGVLLNAYFGYRKSRREKLTDTAEGVN